METDFSNSTPGTADTSGFLFSAHPAWGP